MRDIDKSFWRQGEHDIHFVTQLVQKACNAGRWCWSAEQPETLLAPCEHAWWMVSWLRYLHKFNLGDSAETRRLKDVKRQWLFHTDGLVEDWVEDESPVDVDADATSPARAPSLSQDVWHGAVELLEDTPKTPADGDNFTLTDAAGTTSTLPLAPPPPATPFAEGVRSRLSAVDGEPHTLSFPYECLVSLVGRKDEKQEQGVSWLLAKSRNAFTAQHRQTLALWGFPPEHASTCILVPALWQDVEPRALAATFSQEDLPTNEAQRRSVSLFRPPQQHLP